MEITWDYKPSGVNEFGATFAIIAAPSNLRKRPPTGKLMVAGYTKEKDGRYSTSFVRTIKEHFNPPTQRLHTELGARRRIRKYLELWAIAGYPLGD
jgi:hypothetical protein